jgi:hypothetical protein
MSNEFKKLGCVSDLPELLAGYAATALARPDFQEPTFRCPKCSDSGFVVREDSKRRLYGTRCECLEAEIVAHRTGKPVGPKFREQSAAEQDLPF